MWSQFSFAKTTDLTTGPYFNALPTFPLSLTTFVYATNNLYVGDLANGG